MHTQTHMPIAKKNMAYRCNVFQFSCKHSIRPKILIGYADNLMV